ncbi:MAG: prepilin-type N-terminal cleavage/methylation domain-containing protein [Patescibacteria group bacterium]
MINPRNKKGFTLIEVIIYIALFSLLIGTAFITTHQIIDGSGKLSVKNTTQEEGIFVLRKINYALTGISTITTPSTGNLNSNNLNITKYDANQINIRLNGTKIEMKENVGPNTYLPLTTDNVTVKASSLNFAYIAPIDSSPAGITASFLIVKDGKDYPFSITKYIRK